MMPWTVRPLGPWIGHRTRVRRESKFKADWSDTLDLLNREIWSRSMTTLHDPWAGIEPTATDQREQAGFGEWAIVELMGKRRAAGYVTQAEFPAGFIRLDIPACNGHPASTQFYSPSALYGLHPVSEDLARVAAARFRPEPIHRYELPAAPTLQPRMDESDYEPDDDGDLPGDDLDEDDGP